MSKEPFIRDERTVAVADTSYRFAYTVLAFGVLLATVARGLFFQQACWDLLGLVLVSSGVATVYQRAKHVQVLPRARSLWIVLISAVIASALAIAMTIALKQ